MYACAGILLFVSAWCCCADPQSYLIGLWFSLRTHAAQIYQNPRQLMRPEEQAALHPAIRQTLNQREPHGVPSHLLPFHKTMQSAGSQLNSPMLPSHPGTLRLPPLKGSKLAVPGTPQSQRAATAPLSAVARDRLDPSEPASRVTSAAYSLPLGYSPFLETVDRDMKQHHMASMSLPSTLTTEDFTRAVAVATVSALRHQGSIINSQMGSSRRERSAGHVQHKEEEAEEHGGHEAPSWTRGLSAGVLLGCTLLYAIIAGQ